MLNELLQFKQSFAENPNKSKKLANILKIKVNYYLTEIDHITQQLERAALFEKTDFKKMNTLCKIAKNNYNRLKSIKKLAEDPTLSVTILNEAFIYLNHIDEIRKIVKAFENINTFINDPASKTDPVLIANIEGLCSGNYIAPNLAQLGIFAIKKHFSNDQINKFNDEHRITEDAYEMLMNK